MQNRTNATADAGRRIRPLLGMGPFLRRISDRRLLHACSAAAPGLDRDIEEPGRHRIVGTWPSDRSRRLSSAASPPVVMAR